MMLGTLDAAVYDVPMPHVWFAREDGPTRRDRVRAIRSKGRVPAADPRTTFTPAQPADRDVGLRDLSVTSNNVMALAEGAKAAVIDEIADLLADAIWADLTGSSEGLRLVPPGDLTVTGKGESR